MEGAFLLEVSRRIKEYRLEKRLTVQELADRSGVSKGLISQIENGRSIPSLPVLFGIIQSLEMAVSSFFDGLNLQTPNVIVQRKKEYESFTKEDAKGFLYKRIFVKNVSASTLDFVILELSKNAKREEVSTDAFEYKYIIQGECEYLINGERYVLKEGDSLFFDGRLPHLPRNTGSDKCIMLIVYFFNQK
ncbi:helix-turn-helix domain-containing protein [Taibaiella koreensis]|uniref:helix-turn-helix domain-containing protein n=1 Tax=Taibaiella koreensis TaxID=1268548 RepID=UPI000E59A5BB|nr:XRE family transcriptional regulator [Taibaiella koreensis]